MTNNWRHYSDFFHIGFRIDFNFTSIMFATIVIKAKYLDFFLLGYSYFYYMNVPLLLSLFSVCF